jgi:hypothetical protein
VRLLADALRQLGVDDDVESEGGVMEIFWTIVSFAFVVGTLAVAGYATYRIFGGGHIPQH